MFQLHGDRTINGRYQDIYAHRASSVLDCASIDLSNIKKKVESAKYYIFNK